MQTSAKFGVVRTAAQEKARRIPTRPSPMPLTQNLGKIVQKALGTQRP